MYVYLQSEHEVLFSQMRLVPGALQLFVCRVPCCSLREHLNKAVLANYRTCGGGVEKHRIVSTKREPASVFFGELVS